jgi:co-chaperonin GroES (HSP10)
MKADPNRGMVLIKVHPEESFNQETGLEEAYAKDVSPNGTVVAIGEPDMMGMAVVSVGDLVFVPTSSADQLQLDGETHATVHHSKIRLIFRP